MSIVISGATGTVGKLLIKTLVEQKAGDKVVALVRDEKKAKEILGDKIKYAVGDVTDVKSVKKALKGAERFFILTVTNDSQAEIETRLAEAAIDAGVQHIVKLSVLGATSGDPIDSLRRFHGDSENQILALARKKNVPVTFIRPNHFFQNTLSDDAGSIKGQGAIYRPKGGYSISAVDVRDIALAIAVVLTGDIKKYANRSYNLTGPEPISTKDFAAIYNRVLGKEVKAVEVDDAAWYGALQQHGVPESYAHWLVRLFQTYRLNLHAEELGDFKILTGKEPTSFEQFVKDHVNAFQ